MALLEGCKHELEVTIPAEVIAEETTKVTKGFQSRAKLPGFRPGKAPASVIQRTFAGDIRQKVIENLVPKFFQEKAEQENLRVVSQPNYTDLHFHEGESIHFKAQFEVFPDFQPPEYRGVEVPYRQPSVTDEDVEKRIEELREGKATFINEDPRPLQDNDFAVISLASLAGVDEPIQSDEVVVRIAGPETLAGFTENLRGAAPGDEKEIDVTYPEDFGQEKLAGKTVRFKVHVKGLRRRELPEVNDEFAQDLGDYRTVDELKTAVRQSIYAQREAAAQDEAKNKLVDKLATAADFPVPEVFIERQIQNRVEQRLRSLAEQGVDPSSFKLDWEKIKVAQREPALHEVKASLIIGRIAQLESVHVSNEEVEKEIERIARQAREPLPVVRKKLTDDGTVNNIVNHIQTAKTLNFLFDNATKTEPVDEPAAEAPAAEAAESL